MMGGSYFIQGCVVVITADMESNVVLEFMQTIKRLRWPWLEFTLRLN